MAGYLSDDPYAGERFDPSGGNRGTDAPINHPMGTPRFLDPAGRRPLPPEGAGAGEVIGQRAIQAIDPNMRPIPMSDPNAQQWVNPANDGGGQTFQNPSGLRDQPMQTAPTTLNGTLNEAQFRTWLNQQYLQAGRQPPDQGGFNTWWGYYNQFGKSDPVYLTSRLQQGLKQDAGGGGGFGGGSLAGLGSVQPFQGLSYEDFLKTPGYQAGFKEAQRGLQTSAAAHGTLLNARTNEAMGKSLADYAMNAYGNEFNRTLQTHATQYGDLYNLANLGVNATNSSFS